MKIAIIGGTGPEGTGLGVRWAARGHEVIIGSRKAERADEISAELRNLYPDLDLKISGTDNNSAVADCEVAILSVPYWAQESTLEGLREELDGALPFAADRDLFVRAEAAAQQRGMTLDAFVAEAVRKALEE